MSANEIATDKKMEIFPENVLREKTPRTRAINSRNHIRNGPLIHRKSFVDGINIDMMNGVGTAAIAKAMAIFPSFCLLTDMILSLRILCGLTWNLRLIGLACLNHCFSAKRNARAKLIRHAH